ncbi:MAG: methyltransferase domain-containing protein [Eubacteriales bacterium]|nr:methyltransferase domain-containing protein [Eubacteriales bacterium]
MPAKEILNLDDAAELFGVSVKTFIKLLKEEKVPARKIGREWRFSRSALIEWISRGDSQTYSSSEAETKDFFNSIAPEWDNIRREYYDENISRALTGSGLLKRDMTVVDIGSGSGYLARTAAKEAGRVIAVDISAEMLRELAKRAGEESLNNIEILEADADDVPLENASADMVCASMFLHHSPIPQVTIKEMHRLLKKGGSLFIADFTEHENKELQDKQHDIWNGFQSGTVTAWLKNAGFRDIRFEIIDSAKIHPSVFIMTAKKV